MTTSGPIEAVAVGILYIDITDLERIIPKIKQDKKLWTLQRAARARALAWLPLRTFS